MGFYSAHGQDTNTANTTVLGVSQPASALKRLRISYVSAGSDATADNAFEAVLQRTTAAGTSTSVTPQKRDPADGAASAVAGQAHTVEPTYTSGEVVLSISGHQRSTFQWYAIPGHEIVVPVTNNAGVGFQIITVTAAFNQVVIFEWEE
jgi:hypothetical protein